MRPGRVRADGYFTTRDKLLTRRGVVWLGQTCNLRCHFCYFLDRIEDVHHPEHSFMELAKAKAICRDLRERYGNTAVDIQGGEPTIWRHIDELVAYCVEIGLQPTLITNGVALADRVQCERLQAAGVRDLLVSVQGIGATYDQIVGRAGSWTKQLRGLRNCAEVGIPVRFNCVLSAAALPQLAAIAQLAIDAGALAVSFLAFNPFEDQHEGRRSAENVPRYTEVKAALGPALDLLAAAGVEANVRYLPFCMVEDRHRSSVYNHQQLSYDAHEWDYDSWSWTTLTAQRMKGTPTSAHHPDLAAITYADLGGPSPSGIRSPRVVVMAKAGLKRVLRRSPALLDRAGRWYWRRRARARDASRSASSAGDRSVVADELGRSALLYRDEGRRRASDACGYEHAPACASCSLRRVCDGFHSDYSSLFGTGEAQAVDLGRVVGDPLHFAWAQAKVHEPEERSRPFASVEPLVAGPGADVAALDAYEHVHESAPGPTPDSTLAPSGTGPVSVTLRPRAATLVPEP